MNHNSIQIPWQHFTLLWTSPVTWTSAVLYGTQISAHNSKLLQCRVWNRDWCDGTPHRSYIMYLVGGGAIIFRLTELLWSLRSYQVLYLSKLIHTNYFNCKIVKTFNTIIVAPTCFGLHKPSSTLPKLQYWLQYTSRCWSINYCGCIFRSFQCVLYTVQNEADSFILHTNCATACTQQDW